MKKLAALAMAVLMVVLMAGCQVIRAEAFEKTSIPEGIRNLVFGDVGVSEDEVRDREVEFEDGNYEIEFKKDGVEYEYEVNAETGKIVESEKDRDDDYRGKKTSVESGKGERITSAEALNYALADAGFSENEVHDKDVDFDDGVYEVEFEKDGLEYKYRIDPYTGEVLHSEKDYDDDYREKKTSAENKKSEGITASEALKIALADAGFSENEVYDKDVDFDDGVYEVEFEKDGAEYEYEISAKTGKILDVEIDRDDDWYDDDRDDRYDDDDYWRDDDDDDDDYWDDRDDDDDWDDDWDD